MFEDVAGSGGTIRRRGAVPVLVSVAAHMVTIGLLVLIPILYATSALPEVPLMMAFVAQAAAPPPPPPPPPPPAAPARSAPTPKPIPSEGRFAAPVEAPAAIAPEPAATYGSEEGVPGGVEGGVPGGVVGGIVGGIGVEPPPPPPPPPPAPRAPVRVGGDIREPALVARVDPKYPEIAARAKLQGMVILEAEVDTQGRVRDVRLLRSINPLLDDAAIEAVRQWRYSPLILNGIPEPFVLTVTVTFRLQQPAARGVV